MDLAQKEEILSILRNADDMTVATIRKDGYPQATTVAYVNDDLAIYFAAAADSQKAENIAANNKVSLTINAPYSNWNDIRGISIGGRANRVDDPKEIKRVGEMMLKKFPQASQFGTAGMTGMSLFRIAPEVVSILDYRKGFGHTELVKV